MSGPDKGHWRKAIDPELDSMRLRGVFRAAKLPSVQGAIGTKRVFKLSARQMGRSRIQGTTCGQRIPPEIWHRLHGDVLARGEVCDFVNGHRHFHALWMASRPT